MSTAAFAHNWVGVVTTLAFIAAWVPVLILAGRRDGGR